ncbi:hypothetical protein [Sporomusa sp.]|jgi:hypothetical protein|uniref:hypothetical protein n=1 Tax=Sporomusa sp. TaxID=2078658 RepID=UPI002C211768|nr:hypothetical protein [Sporomusa sp.]MDF2874697.1 hypothetical protein [Sporomusa sp.]HWR09855.1 hypothetical protein [Sporomusa sp.]
MQKVIRKLIVTLLLSMIINLYPSSALAAEFSFNINIARQDGATCGELWLNDRLVWRLALLSDGAKPVSGGFNGANTTLVIPDIVNGMFVVKVE